MEKRPSSPAQHVRIESELLRESFFQTGDAAAVLERRSLLVDSVVERGYEEFLAPAYGTGIAALAVGGYGRRELFPHSDIDLLFLVAEPPAGVRKEALSRVLQSLWDSGLRLSHSVRTVKECCEVHEGNIELNISLIDQRLLAGDDYLYSELSLRLPKFLQSQRQNLARHLCKLTHQRHGKFHETIHHLEPNIKETPGGLRDIHLIGWLGKLWGSIPAELEQELESPRRFLNSLRCCLHYRANRDDNLLSFDAQEELVEQPFLHFGDAAHSMREYFRNARGIHRAALRSMETFEAKGNALLAGFRDWRARLSTTEFTVSRDRVLFRSPQQMDANPELVLRLFQLVARHKIALHGETERRILESLPLLARHFSEPRNLWPQLHEILNLPHAAAALRAMHDTGVLSAIFPEWREIESYVIRDFNHRYTVDEHTLIAIESLEELSKSKQPELERFRNLLAELEDPAMLRLALLFHDTGKGSEGESHCAGSARLAGEAAQRVGVPVHPRKLLTTLIEQHLTLSAAMTGRDLEDPATPRWLAEKLETIEVLRYLTLLTYADTSAVHPSALSPWRLEQLWRVHLTAHRELTRELDTSRILATSPEMESFLKGFPTRYLRIHTEEEVQHHMMLEERRRQAGVAIELRKAEGAYQLTVLAKDRLFLFASVAGALSSFGLNILKAEAFANQQGTILDTFAFEDPQRTLELNPSEVDRVRQTLERVILGKVDVKALLRNRPNRPAPSKGSRIPGSVTFDSEASEAATLVEVIAQDRPGLLYDLAAAFSESGCSIDVVLIDTEAHRALDVFYVTANGTKLDEGARKRLSAKLTQVCSI